MAVATDVASLLDGDLDGLSSDELSARVLECQRLRGQLEAAEARLLSRWDAQKCWQPSGAKTGAAWLAWKQRIPIEVARERLRHARALRTMPEVAEAWAVGEIDRSHLATMLRKRTARTSDVFDTDYKQLLDWARTERYSEFKRRCDRWELTVDPDGAEQGADADRAARDVHLSPTLGGMWYGKMTLDPISGTIVHDALVEMAIRARTAPKGGRRPAPLFTVMVGYETLTGPLLELFNRTVVTPGSVVQHLSDAYIERVVFDAPSRVIDVGAQRRFYRDALRRAIEVRDRTCFHPSCDDVPQRPHVDHIHEASKGGPTTQANGRWGCSHHNLWRNTHTDDWHDDQTSPRPSDPHAGPDPPDDS